MEQLKTMLLVEYRKRKSTYWWPVWIIAGLTVLSLITMLIVWLIERPDIVMYGGDGGKMGLRIDMYGVMFSFGVVFLAFMGLGAQSSLNREKQLGSDLFFRCQPVCYWKVTGVKYFMHVGNNFKPDFNRKLFIIFHPLNNLIQLIIVIIIFYKGENRIKQNLPIAVFCDIIFICMYAVNFLTGFWIIK